MSIQSVGNIIRKMLTERILSFLIWIPMVLGQGQVEGYQETLEIKGSGFNCSEEIKNTKQEFKKKMEDLENQNRNLQNKFDTLQLKLDRLLERSEGHEACFDDIGSDNCTGSKSGLIGIVEAIRVDGEWGPFSYWSQCSASCGGGVQVKERTCNNPAPKNGGKPCKGEAVEQRTCNAHLCNDCNVGERHDGNCYQLVSTPSSWYNAKLDCTRRNGSLASIPDIETSYTVAHIAGGGATRAWIGASDAETEGSWKWTNGEIATFTNWSPANPDNWDGIQHCAVINYHSVGKWDDDSCGALHPYVCQGQNMTKGADDFGVIGGVGYRGTSQRGGQRGYPFRRSDTTGCQFGWKWYGDKCYKVFPQVLATYAEASQKCRREQANVAAVETLEENLFIKALLNQEQLPHGRDLWLSGRRQNRNSAYFWGTGREVVYADWERGQPHQSSDLCMQIFKNTNPYWSWYTEPCYNYNQNDNGVLCEKAAN